MAEKEEVELLIIDDDEEEEIEKDLIENEEKPPHKKKSNTPLIILIISLILLSLIGIGGFLILQEEDDEVIEPDTNASEIIKNIKKNETKQYFDSPLDRLTKKAKKLYESGKTEEALKIYEKISLFHKSLADFNLGVTLFKDKKYKTAIEHFQVASNLDELKFESYLNIALSYKELDDIENFQKYIKLADKIVISKYDSPLFNYYLGLLEYYKDMPLESLVILRKYNKKFFSENQNIILAKEYVFIKNYNLAIDNLSKIDNDNYYLTIAQLYAKNGEYSLSAKAFRNAISSGKNSIKARVGLSLVQNKLGLFESCSSNLKTINTKYADKATKIYPIKVLIKKSLHDPKLAQQEFKNSIFNNIQNRFALLFYFAPYKLYDPKQSNFIIEKGAKEIYIDNINSAFKYLTQANSISQINLEIINGLKLLQKHKVYEANRLFKKMITKYPNHSILHYNLALTYANIADYQNANKHFNKSFILDNKNILSLFFSSFTAILNNKDYDAKKLENIIKYADKETLGEYKLLYKIIKNDSALSLENNTITNPFKLIINIIASNMIHDNNSYKQYTEKLKKLLPKDLITNIIYVDQISQNKDIKEYAKAVQEYLTRKSIDISPLLYGETFARELYIRILNIGGITRFAKSVLENEFTINKNQIALLQSLAYTYIYTKEYEKSYQIYNKLIDEFKVDDPHTLFLASVSAIGSNHHANAIALLELANLTNKKFFESRYALGLLYQEAKNFEGAAIQYAQIGNSGFKSKYFDFDLKH